MEIKKNSMEKVLFDFEQKVRSFTLHLFQGHWIRVPDPQFDSCLRASRIVPPPFSTLERNNDRFRSSLPRHRLPVAHLLLPRRPRRPAPLLLPQRLVRSLLAHDAESRGYQGTQGRVDAGFEVDRVGFAGSDRDCGVFHVPTVRRVQRAAREVGRTLG